jgi:ribosomal 50S subunit-associated protein YjgA (DUF615 family)
VTGVAQESAMLALVEEIRRLFAVGDEVFDHFLTNFDHFDYL